MARMETERSALIRPPRGLNNKRPIRQRPESDLFSMSILKELDFDTALTAIALFSLIAAFGVGSKALAVFLGCAAIQLMRNPLVAIATIYRGTIFLAIPALAIASAAWSTRPDLSLKGGLQLLLGFCCALILCSKIDSGKYVRAIFIATFLAAIACLALPSKSEGALVSYLGSKNQVSFLAGVLSLASISMLFQTKRGLLLKYGSILGILCSLYLITAAHSAGGLVEFALGIPLVIALSGFSRLSIQWRIGAILVIFALIPIAFFLASDVQNIGNNVIVNVLHKDTTLTGRTYLWFKAKSIIAAHPLLGVGYHNFWVQGNLDPEGLWAYFYIPNRSGFNFHNEYIDMTIVLGQLGAIALTVTLLLIIGSLSLQAIFRPTVSTSFFLTFVITAVLRTSTETGLIAEFNIYTQILLAAGSYGLFVFQRNKSAGGRHMPRERRKNNNRHLRPLQAGVN